MFYGFYVGAGTFRRIDQPDLDGLNFYVNDIIHNVFNGVHHEFDINYPEGIAQLHKRSHVTSQHRETLRSTAGGNTRTK